ncbi:pathogenesis-related thaumatin-like protein 3.5 [Corylus avellana]|uniref:pathogenesis-related thaumatin-like protein 3.5 n=1 Tax=Corylus avellana TaxID=13451 RepID=UPI001E219B29|nr:pathogenesis-related thaumatin-like protein 3.5 [Corylus avellana]XP_059439259.1 pathogenesis-related thaumatin-like protein 3.5 [Corylus avellana]
MASLFVYITLLALSLLSGVVYSAKLTIINKCNYTVWPAIRSNHANTHLPTTGFTLYSNNTITLYVNKSWSGALWGRTGCAKNSTGAFSCLTGDCGSSTVECPDGNPASPATAAAFDLKDHEDNVDFLVQAFPGLSYNLPMTVVPLGGIGGSCNESGCSMDFSSACPTATDVSASCKNATCEMRDYKKYCCMAGPKIVAPCTPSLYMDFLHQKCPTADSIGYDEGTGTYTCSYLHDIVSYCQKPCTTTPTDYVITFCLPAAIE